MAVHRCSPLNLIKPDGICREELEKLSKSKHAEHVETYPIRLEDKGVSTKYNVQKTKGLGKLSEATATILAFKDRTYIASIFQKKKKLMVPHQNFTSRGKL